MSPIITIISYGRRIFNYQTPRLYLHIASFSDQTSISCNFEMRNGKFFILSLFHQYGMPEVQVTAELISDMQPPESLQVQWDTSESSFYAQEEPIMVNILVSIRGPTISLLYYVRWVSDNIATDDTFTHAFNYVS